MQIWKSPNLFVLIQKQYHRNFAFLILKVLELFTREVHILLTLTFNFTVRIPCVVLSSKMEETLLFIIQIGLKKLFFYIL